MMPIAPAFDTAEASCDLAIQPIGACTMGISIPSICVTLFVMVMPGSSHATLHDADEGALANLSP